MAGLVATDGVTQTAFEPRAVGQLLELWQRVMPGDAPGEARFRDVALLDPGFSPDGLVMLWRAGRLIGFGYAVAGSACSDGSRPGWLVGLGVAPEERGQGHGTRLLESCVRFLTAAGCSAAQLGGNGERYLLPGADPVAYPEFRWLIQAGGFQLTGRTEAMECDLGGWRPEQRPAGGERYAYRHPDDGDLPGLLRMVSGFSENWAGLVRGYLARAEEPANIWAAYGPGGIVGFAGFDLFPGCPGRFGPTGVIPAARGHGAGARLLGLSLASLAERGHRSAWFLWGPEGTAGRRMYASAGFRVSRTFEFFSRDLLAPGAGRNSNERKSG
jgi:GNAT superfamily N-acetyltransferase